MNQGIRTVVYPVKDLARAKALYRQLWGVEPYANDAITSASRRTARASASTPTVTTQA
jgi:hypothetical protein